MGVFNGIKNPLALFLKDKYTPTKFIAYISLRRRAREPHQLSFARHLRNTI